MQAIAIAIAASILASTAAYANDVDPNGFEKQHFISSASRADVVADLKVAQKQGLLQAGELGPKVIVIAEPTSKTRAQVAAEASVAKHVYGEVGDISE